jgi:hypothetical protein
MLHRDGDKEGLMLGWDGSGGLCNHGRDFVPVGMAAGAVAQGAQWRGGPPRRRDQARQQN